MTPHSLLSQLREKGIQIKLFGSDRVVVDAPKGALTPELRSALSIYKSEILRALQAEERGEENSDVDSRDLATTANLQREEPRVMLDSAVVSNMDKQSRGIEDLEAELSRLRAEIEARRAEAKNRRSAAENAMRLEDEHCRKIDEEVARQRAHEERLQIESEELERAEEENRRLIADQELALLESELQRVRAAEQQRRSEVEARRHAQEEGRRAEIERRRIDDEERARSRFEQERQCIEAEARSRVQEEEALRRTEKEIRAIEEDIARLHARDEARRKATGEAAHKAEEEARRRMEEEARRQAQEEALRRAEEEARLRARIEAEMRAEAEACRKAELEARRLAEEEQRRLAEEEARRRAQEEALRLAEEGALRVAQEELQRRAEEDEVRRREGEAARLRAEEESRRRVQAEAEARRRAEAEARQKAAEEAQRRADLEARIRAEIEAKIREEEEAEERLLMPEEYRPKKDQEAGLKNESSNRPAVESSNTESSNTPSAFESLNSNGVAEEVGIDGAENRWPEGLTELVADSSRDQEEINAVASDQTYDPFTEFGYEELNGRFQPVSLPESEAAFEELSSETWQQLRDDHSAQPDAVVPEQKSSKSDRAFQHIVESFDDQDVEVRNAGARALFSFQSDRAAAFTQALREASPERRKNIGQAIVSSGLANESIDNLTGENKETTYDAFSLLFLMSKAGEFRPLMSAIEEHSNMEVRLAVVKLLALSGQPSILPAFRRMAARESLPPEVRSAVMEAIYQMTSQTPAAETTTVN